MIKRAGSLEVKELSWLITGLKLLNKLKNNNVIVYIIMIMIFFVHVVYVRT